MDVRENEVEGAEDDGGLKASNVKVKDLVNEAEGARPGTAVFVGVENRIEAAGGPEGECLGCSCVVESMCLLVGT